MKTDCERICWQCSCFNSATLSNCQILIARLKANWYSLLLILQVLHILQVLWESLMMWQYYWQFCLKYIKHNLTHSLLKVKLKVENYILPQILKLFQILWFCVSCCEMKYNCHLQEKLTKWSLVLQGIHFKMLS